MTVSVVIALYITEPEIEAISQAYLKSIFKISYFIIVKSQKVVGSKKNNASYTVKKKKVFHHNYIMGSPIRMY